MTAIEDKDGWMVSVRIKGMTFWVDVDFPDGELRIDWNQYIFMTNDKEHMKRKAVQSSCYWYVEICSRVRRFLLRKKLMNEDCAIYTGGVKYMYHVNIV